MNAIIEIIKPKNGQTTDAAGNVIVVPTSPYEFRTAPLREGEAALLIGPEAYIGLLLGLYQFDDTLKNIVPFDTERFGEFIRAGIATA